MLQYTSQLKSPVVGHQYGAGLALVILGWMLHLTAVFCLWYLRREEFRRVKRLKELNELLDTM